MVRLGGWGLHFSRRSSVALGHMFTSTVLRLPRRGAAHARTEQCLHFRCNGQARASERGKVYGGGQVQGVWASGVGGHACSRAHRSSVPQPGNKRRPSRPARLPSLGCGPSQSLWCGPHRDDEGADTPGPGRAAARVLVVARDGWQARGEGTRWVGGWVGHGSRVSDGRHENMHGRLQGHGMHGR